MKMLRGVEISRFGGMLGDFIASLAGAVDAAPVDLGIVPWFRTNPGKEAIDSAVSQFWGVVRRVYEREVVKSGGTVYRPNVKSSRRENPYLRLVASGAILPMNSQRTFVRSQDMFPGYFSLDFEKRGTDIPSETPLLKADFDVFELVKPGKLRDILGGFNVNIQELLWPSQELPLSWVDNHQAMLLGKNWSAFFPFLVKGEGMSEWEAFVSRVYSLDDCLRARLFDFSNKGTWRPGGGHWFVLPRPA